MAVHVPVYEAREDGMACAVDGEVCFRERRGVAEVDGDDGGRGSGEEDAA